MNWGLEVTLRMGEFTTFHADSRAGETGGLREPEANIHALHGLAGRAFQKIVDGADDDQVRTLARVIHGQSDVAEVRALDRAGVNAYLIDSVSCRSRVAAGVEP